jgi:hypothetical protein
VLIVDSLIISGVKFVLTRLVEAVESEMYDETSLREELLAAQMKLELGEITDDEFEQIEEQILAGMREVRERRKAASGAPRADADPSSGRGDRKIRVESVDASLEWNEVVDDKR